MLTEGWDTRTVTHVLGYRAFSTQLLCEQVTGRALRRSNYDAVDDDGLLMPEYAEVIGVPFEFMPNRTGIEQPAPPRPRYEVHTVPARPHRRIEWPNVVHYLRETGTDRFDLAEADVRVSGRRRERLEPSWPERPARRPRSQLPATCGPNVRRPSSRKSW